ncbi:MAG: Ig-like domain-containing protein [Jatrophihabitantaceae bacterium]
MAVAIPLFGLVVLATATPASALEGTVPSTVASSWQTNNTVNAIAAANGVVYVGGAFTSVRPPGAAAGTGEVARSYLAAFNASTGALITSFNHTLNGAVSVLTASSDGQTIYAGGDFTSVDGSTRNRIASFTASSGALTAWNPNANDRVAGISPFGSTVYVAGYFSTIGGRTERRVAALSASTGAALATFNATPDNIVYQSAISPAGDRLYLAGAFLSVNGDPSYHAVVALDTATGNTVPFAAASVIPPKTDACTVEAKTVKTDSSGVYFGVEGTGGGCFDGTFAANNDGSLRWQSLCLGATQAVQPIGGVLYTGSHSHDCSGDQGKDPDAFPEVGWSLGLSRHLLSRSTSGGLLGNWYPNTNGGPGGAGLGPRVMATDGSQLFVGGEFTTVNGLTQQGFARFSPATGDLAAPARPATPSAVALPGGRLAVYVQAPLDTDDTDLTVRIYRDGGGTPIFTSPVHSLFWRDPVVSYLDSGLPLGSTHTYTADAIETNGSNASSKSAASRSVTVVNTASSAYEAAVDQDNPSIFWRYGENAGPVVADSGASSDAGVSQGTVSYGVAGAVTGSTAVTTNGATGFISTSQQLPSPTNYSLETWFKTTSTSGGKLIGFGDRQGGYDFNGNPAVSGSYDKQVYLTADGHLKFGVWVGFADTVTSGNAYNDGQWHQVVATQSSQGLNLFVDGAKVAHDGQTNNQAYNGYWRVGGDNLGGWPNASGMFFNGSIDETAVYDHALNLGAVQSHYAASGRTPPPSTVPADDYGKAVYNDNPANYWRLDEPGGASTAADSTDNSTTGNYVGGVTQGAPGALGATGHAVTFNGSTGNVTSTSQIGGPSRYALELWFNTTTGTGGKLLGFGNAQTGSSSNYDKHVYMTNTGQLIFGVYNGSFDMITTPGAYNDGQWHYVVAMQGPSGMAMYVDDHLIGSNGVATNQGYSGYWRVGGDNLNAWPSQPSTAYFAGTIDEVAVYDGPLTPGQIDAHYTASGRTGPDIVAPTTAITAPADGAGVSTGTVAVSATAADNVGVTAVDLQVDGSTVGTDTSAPYTFSWTATAGPHTLRTVAHDAAGNTGNSADVHVTATAPDTTNPTTAITSPSDGDSVYGPITVSADAADNVGVTSVSLLVDGSTVGTDTSAPYTFSWNATDVGNHTLRTVASDAAGNTGSSSLVNVTVPADTTPPSAPGPLSSSNVTANSVTLSWAAATDDRAIGGYQIVRDGSVVGSTGDTNYTDTGLSSSTSYSYTVHAVDATGNVGPDTAALPVTTAASNPVLFAETWPGADGSAWPAAWTTSTGNGTVDTQAGAGRLSIADVASSFGRAQLTGLANQSDTELLTSFSWSANTAVSYLGVYLRGSGGWQNGYRPKNGYGLELQSNSGAVVVRKDVNGTVSTLATITGAQQLTTAKQWLRLRVSGSTIQFKIWTDGSTEPAAWASTSTDTSITAPGQLFLSLNRGGTNVGVKAVSFDDLTVRAAP